MIRMQGSGLSRRLNSATRTRAGGFDPFSRFQLFFFSFLFFFLSPPFFSLPRHAACDRHGKIRKGILGGRLPSLHDLTRDPSLFLSNLGQDVMIWEIVRSISMRSCKEANIRAADTHRAMCTRWILRVSWYRYVFRSRDACKYFAKQNCIFGFEKQDSIVLSKTFIIYLSRTVNVNRLKDITIAGEEGGKLGMDALLCKKNYREDKSTLNRAGEKHRRDFFSKLGTLLLIWG